MLFILNVCIWQQKTQKQTLWTWLKEWGEEDIIWTKPIMFTTHPFLDVAVFFFYFAFYSIRHGTQWMESSSPSPSWKVSLLLLHRHWDAGRCAAEDPLRYIEDLQFFCQRQLKSSVMIVFSNVSNKYTHKSSLELILLHNFYEHYIL